MSKFETMLGILLAIFIVQVLPLLMIVAAVILVLKARKRRPHGGFMYYLGIALAGLPVGIFAYIFAGIAAARIRGEGHFYSVPFGGYTVDDAPIGISLLICIGFLFGVLAFIFRRRQ